MPRISYIEGYNAGEISDAQEWIVGDSDTIEGLWSTDTAPVEPVDLDGAAIRIEFEFYTAMVREVASQGEVKIDVRELVLDAARPVRVLDAVVDADQVANTGVFTWFMPTDIYAGNPKPDIEERVPVAIVFLVRTIGIANHTERFLTVFRRGAPGAP